MIRLICTNCKATLEMDDAFAGGVCRCQYCGTIQTVPSSLKKNGRSGAPAPASKTLYQRKFRTSAGQATAAPPAAGAGPEEPNRETKLRAAAPTIAPPRRDPKQLRPVLIVT